MKIPAGMESMPMMLLVLSCLYISLKVMVSDILKLFLAFAGLPEDVCRIYDAESNEQQSPDYFDDADENPGFRTAKADDAVNDGVQSVPAEYQY